MIVYITWKKCNARYRDGMEIVRCFMSARSIGKLISSPVKWDYSVRYKLFCYSSNSLKREKEREERETERIAFGKVHQL